MKSKLLLTSLLLLGATFVHAADKVAGPKGGRLLEKTEPRAEFYVEKNRTVTIMFYDANLKPMAAGQQSLTVIADAKEGKARLEFEKKGDVLVSKGKLPDGDSYPVVVQLRALPDSRPQNFRFQLDSHLCGGCKRAEYACTCAH